MFKVEYRGLASCALLLSIAFGGCGKVEVWRSRGYVEGGPIARPLGIQPHIDHKGRYSKLDQAKKPTCRSIESIQEACSNQADLACLKNLLAHRNRCLIQRDYHKEWIYNSGNQQDRPALALALSGGGMRSASFSIGVMAGLEEVNELQNIDVISSSSGGSYANSWYFLQSVYGSCRPTAKGLFDPLGPYQRHLENKGALFNSTRYVLAFLSNLGMSPVNFLANGLLGWHQNTTPARRWYENQIQDAFHVVPHDACPESLGAIRHLLGMGPNQSAPLLSYGVNDSTDVNELGRSARDQKSRLPAFVFNTTAVIDDDLNHANAQLHNTVFEITPFRMGSDGLGYIDWENAPWTPSVSRTVAISGAALDGSIIAGSTQKTFWANFNQDMGFYINNFNARTLKLNKARTSSDPLPFLLRPQLLTRQERHKALSDRCWTCRKLGALFAHPTSPRAHHCGRRRARPRSHILLLLCIEECVKRGNVGRAVY